MDLPSRIGRYDVERLLGEGGMGRVLLARDSVLGRRVALKVLRDDLALPPDLHAQLVERMRQEARAAAALSHPGIVTLLDMGEDERVGLYLVFELIDGPTLRERLDADGPLPPHEVGAMARTLGSALAHAHAAGVFHRDVKPHNVMLARTGARLTDLGVARLPDSTLTGSAVVLGTPAYSSPESLSSGAFGPRSDQFSLAATLYEALTGVRAFPGEDALAVSLGVESGRHVAPTAALPSLRAFADVDGIFARALAREAAARFPSCLVLGDLLGAALEGSKSTSLTPVPPTSQVTRQTRRAQNVAAAVGVVVIAALVVAGRQQPAERGASLHDAASAFASAVGVAPHPVAASHRVHPTSSASQGGATPAPPPDPDPDAGQSAGPAAPRPRSAEAEAGARDL